MRPPETVYRGERIENARGGFVGVRVMVDGRPLTLPRNVQGATGFEWGYGGAGPGMLSLAILFDVTGDRLLSIRAYRWFMWATTSCWGCKWSITAGRVLEWIEQFERESRDEPIVLDPDDDDSQLFGMAGCDGRADDPVVIEQYRVHAKHAAKGPHASAAGEGGAS